MNDSQDIETRTFSGMAAGHGAELEFSQDTDTNYTSINTKISAQSPLRSDEEIYWEPINTGDLLDPGRRFVPTIKS